MTIIYYPDADCLDTAHAATIGFFDGLHRGHVYLLEQLRSLSAARGLHSMAITFDRHPREVVSEGWHAQLLTTLDEKAELLSATGIDTMVVLRFDSSMARLTARQFMADVLLRDLGVKALLTGYDNRFGHDRTATFTNYVAYGRDLGIDVEAARPLTTDDGDNVVISSSIVRRMLASGDVENANRCLGREYAITGTVVHGEEKGRVLGFPTANINCDDSHKVIPARGAYATIVKLADGTVHPAMTNIGTRPTFHGQQQTIETHIFGDIGNIYGAQLTLHFAARLRDEISFASPKALAEQLAKDRQQSEEIIKRITNYDYEERE